jgi:hypothetical protein
MRRASLTFLVLTLGLAGWGCAPKNSHLIDPGLRAGTRTVNAVALVPPRVELKCEEVGGERDCGGMDRDLAGLLEEVASEAMAGHGYRLVSARTTPEELAEDPDRAAWLDELEGRYLAEGPLEAGPPESSLGEAAPAVAADTGADALLLIKGRGVVHSGGMQTLAFSADVLFNVVMGAACILGPFDVCVGAGSSFYPETLNNLDYEMALVDGRDGTVLLRLWGRTSLDEFVTSGAPGKKHYADRLENLRARIRDHLNEQFDEAFK